MQRLLLVLVFVFLIVCSISFGRAQASYQPGVKPGDTITYGQVSASWVSSLNPQSPFANFLNVSSIQNVVSSVNQDNVTLGQTKTYNNGTMIPYHLLYDTQSGYGNYTPTIPWAIAKGLEAPEAGYETPQAPIIIKTVEKVYLGTVRTVNVFSQFQVFSGGYVSVEEDYDQQTGILLYLTITEVYSSIYSVTARLNIVITRTSLWSPPLQPDFAIYANPYNATILKGSSVNSTISFQSLNNFQGTVNLSQTVSPTGPMVTLNQTTRTISSGGVVNVLLNFSTSPSVSAASYRVNITATDSPLVHSTIFNVTVTGPGYSLSPAQDYIAIPTNSSGTDSVTLTSVGRFNGTITLKAVPLTAGPALSLNPSTITVKAGTNTTTITIITHLVPSGYYTLQVNGTGPLLQTAYIYLQVLPGPPDFTISLDPPFASSDPLTGIAATHIILTSVNDFVGTVVINDYFINGTSNTFLGLDNPTLNADQSTSIQYKVLSPPISLGCCGIVQIVATSGSLSHSANFTIYVPPGPDFSVVVSPSNTDVPQGIFASANVTVTNTGTVAGFIQLSASPSGSFYGGWGFSPDAVALAPGASGTVLFEISPSSPTLGKFNFTIDAHDNTHSHTLLFTLAVLAQSAGFTISSSAGTLTVQAGSSTSSNILLTSLDNFYANISMFSSASPGFVLGWTSQRVQLTKNATMSSMLTITVPNSIVPGTYTLNTTASGNGIVHMASIMIQVVAPPVLALPDFTITVNPTQLNIRAGDSYTASVILNGVHNFNGTINLTTPNTSGPALSFNTQTLVLSYVRSVTTTTLTITLPANATPGSTYTITITATNGTTTRQARIVVTAMTSSQGQPTNPGVGGLSISNAIALSFLIAGIVTLSVFFVLKRRDGQKASRSNESPPA